MRTPRHFTLINGKGQELNMTEEKLFFYSPEGLGFERNDSYRQVGDRFVLVNTQPKQQTISGKVGLFGEDPYEAYFSFIQFINVYPLTLVYTPNPAADPNKTHSGIAYRRNVIVSRVEKTEVNQLGYLEVSVELTCVAPWYKPVVVTQDNNGEVSNDRFVWNVTWHVSGNAVKFGSDSMLSTGIESDSNTDSPCKLTIYGPLTNPYWKHYVNGVLFEEGAVNTTVRQGEYLVVDNTADPYQITVYDREGTIIQNAYQDSDFSTARFITLKHGINTISVYNEEGVLTPTKAEAMIYYESV